MNNFTGKNGTISCPSALGITVKSVQSDISDPTANDISVTLSGVVSGTVHAFSAVSPIVSDLVFYKDEDVTVTGTGASLNTVVVNYIYRGDQSSNLGEDRDRPVNKKLLPGKWDVN